MRRLHYRLFVIALLFTLFYSGLSAQGLSTELSEADRIILEYSAISSGKISDDNFLQPVRMKKPGYSYLNLFSRIDKKFRLEPVFALRWSESGFELASEHTPSPVLWITPGVKFSMTLPIFAPYTSMWIYAWGRFHKHSAYSLDKHQISNTDQLFPFTPDYSSDFHTRTIKPRYGVDFDEGQGGISLMSPSFEITFGKFRSSSGPFTRSNLGYSWQKPAASQFRVHYNQSNKLHFTFFLASLYSDVRDENLYIELYSDTLDVNAKYPVHPRFITHHRLDILPMEWFRIGLYEQVIFGGREMVFEYMNPFFPFWSAQHSLGDVDNIQMGLDAEILYKNFRLMAAFFMDEWAPFSTFQIEENHNWFSWQLGFSLLFEDLGQHAFDLLLKGEYAWCDPRTYVHRFPINSPQHYGYNLGYWSGGNSDDLWIAAQLIIGRTEFLQLSFQRTRKGQQDVAEIYEGNQSGFLQGDVQDRIITGLQWDRQLAYGLAFRFNASYYKTENLYTAEEFGEIMFAILYNIPY